MEPEKPVIVTTEHKGVFFGWIDANRERDRTLELTRCRCAIYWAGTAGFLGLAATGPEKGSRIGAEVPRYLVHDVTSVADCTEEAVKRWNSYK